MKIIAVLFLSALACACADEPGYLSPLFESPPEGGYDVLMEGVASVRSAELAPGADPARPRIHEGGGSRIGRFVVTYGGDVNPEEIGALMVESFLSAEFLVGKPEVFRLEPPGFVAHVHYETGGATGQLSSHLKETDAANRLAVTYEIYESLK